MKNLSLWAKNNRTKALFVTIVLHVLLSYWYFYFGAFLFLQKIILPSSLIYFSGLLFLISYLFYPMKGVRKGIFKKTFYRKKQWQFVAMLSAAIFMILAGNHSTRSAFSNQNYLQEYSAQQVVLDIKKGAKLTKKENRKLLRKAKRQFRKRIRNNVRKMRNASEGMSSFTRELLMLLSFITAMGLCYLVLILSCNIACAGFEALALVFALGSFVLIFIGLIKIIRKLKRGGIQKEAFETKDILG